MKRRRPPIATALAAILLVSCSSREPSTAPATDQAGQSLSLTSADIIGRWRVLSIDDKPPVARPGSERLPYIEFTENTVGGTLGCNAFGGLGLLANGHYAIHSWGSTLIGCHGALGDQEQAVSKLFFGRPAATSVGRNRLHIASKDHSLNLERLGPNQDPPVSAGPIELTGTSWRVVMMDGSEAAIGPENRYLHFSAGRWEARVSCATLSARWQRDGDRLIVRKPIVSTEQACPPNLAEIDAAFAEMMLARPRFLVGPNGELLIAGAGHALTGDKIQ